jgi:biotin carboxylase
MNHKRTLMVVGAGLGQIPAIEEGKKMGLSVIAVDRNPLAPGMNLADIALSIDVVDVENVLLAARKYQIDGIMTMQSDLPVPTVGFVVDALELPGTGLRIANLCSNKILMREHFREYGIPQPNFRVVSSILAAKVAASEIGYPCIFKAPDSSGSRGVRKVSNEGQAEAAFLHAQKYARVQNILIEEFISGIEVGAQGFSLNSKCQTVLVHNDTLSAKPYMIPIGHSFPFVGEKGSHDNIKAISISSVEALGITDGPTNIDIIVDKDGQAKIIEIGARIGATCLPELVEYHTGINWVRAAIESCLGDSVDLHKTKDTPIAAVILESPLDGEFNGYDYSEDSKNELGVCEWEVTAKIGEEVNKLRKGTDRIGKVLATGRDTIDAELNAASFKDSFIFHVK